MQIAYLVLAHSDPRHLERLIQRLLKGDGLIFVHVDKKSDFSRFEHLKNEKVHLIEKRAAVYWGDYSQVEAILNLLDTALGSQFTIDRLVLLSGVDYPIRSLKEINAFFTSHRSREFLNAVQMPSAAAGKPIERLNNVVVRPVDPKPLQLLKRAARKLGVLARKRDHAAHLKGLVPYGGSTWWAITREAGEYALSFVDARPDIVEFFKHVEYPDESFFQTILMNSRFGKNVVRNLTYTDWRNGGSSPSLINENHLPMFLSGISFSKDDAYGDGPALFARKFRDGQDALLDSLDAVEIGETRFAD
jgi:hypothetical protein